jgi:carboxypeptidase Taq
MATPREAYDALIAHVKQTALLGSCASVLSWDRETYMPKGGAAHRAEQLALLAGMCHERGTDPRMGDWLDACEGTDLVADGLSVEAVNVRELRRSYDKGVKVPNRLVEETARTASLGHQGWVDAREDNDFKQFLPWLEKMVPLRIEYAEAVGYEEVIYDALLDDFETGETTANLTAVFGALRDDLAPLIREIAAAPKQPDESILTRRYDVVRQRVFSEMCASAVGFDFAAGRLDTVVHPFCSRVGPDDVRITTRWDEHQFGSALFGVLHESGHGLYEQGLPAEHYGTPMGSSTSLGIHESQSRLWENVVGRSHNFWTHFYPKAQGVFHESLRDVSLDDLVHAINGVKPSFIRVEADEATYNLHIVLRFELEQEIIAGNLRPADIPGAWNEKFKQMFDLDVPDDANGCLQDVHWSFGGFGYFPTYALGNLYAAQFFDCARREMPDLEAGFARGEFGPLLAWFREKVHSQASRFRPKDLVREVTGEPLSHAHLIRYLREKYEPMYGL